MAAFPRNVSQICRKHVQKVQFRSLGTSKFEWELDEMPVYQYARDPKKSRKLRNAVFSWGLAATGACGIREFIFPKHHPRQLRCGKVPCRVPFGEKHSVTKVACGYGHSLIAIKSSQSSSKLWGCGLNTSCQLGFHPSNKQPTVSKQWLVEPTPISLPLRSHSTKITDLACGRVHSLIATDKEGVFSLGHNASGQCGRKIIDNEDYSTNRVVHKGANFQGEVKQVCCGLDHSLILTQCGRVYVFGLGADGQLGNNSYDCQYLPQLVGGVLENTKIVQISSKGDCTLALSDSGEVFGWGNNEYSQLTKAGGNSPQLAEPQKLHMNVDSRVVCVAAGGSACGVVTESGRVYVWGFGLIGAGPDCVASPTPILLSPTLFGITDYDKDTKVTWLEAGLHSFAALTNKGDLYTWGKNRFSVLGLGHDKDQSFPMRVNLSGRTIGISCGADHVMALTRPYIT